MATAGNYRLPLSYRRPLRGSSHASHRCHASRRSAPHPTPRSSIWSTGRRSRDRPITIYSQRCQACRPLPWRRLVACETAARRADRASVASLGYTPRDATGTVLHQVVREHLESFLATTTRADPSGLPTFLEQEFRAFLDCGVWSRGFARFQCSGCHAETLVPFSCKRRGFCPSCCGRRMAAGAAALVDHILPHVPIRQWVLSLPHALRYRLAWDHVLCRAVLGIYTRALLGFERRRGRRRGIAEGRSGTVTAIQRFGGGVQLNVHFHTLLLEGVFARGADGMTRFHPAPPPTDREVARLLATIRTRILRLLRRRDVLTPDGEDVEADPLAADAPVLAQLSAAAVRGRSAFGDRAGTPVLRVGRDPDAPWVWTVGPRHAHLERFDLHADRDVRADDRLGLERLCRYLLRPPLAQERLSRLADGRVVCTLRSPWHDGTRHLIFTPHEFLERLAAITPRPHINLVLYHGVLAPRARWRPPGSSAPTGIAPATAPSTRSPMSTSAPLAPSRMPSFPTVPGATTAAMLPSSPPPNCSPPLRSPPEFPIPGPPTSPPAPAASRMRRAWAWADLMRRVFAIDVLACAGCGGRLRFIATIEDPPVVAKILNHLGLPTQGPALMPARPPPQLDGFDVA